MNKENLFKGKHTHALPQNEHLDGAWVCGYLCDKYHINSSELEGEFLIDPETVCQYINYDDIRKNKVFDNDIVFCEENRHTGIITYDKGGYVIDWGDDGEHLRNDVDFWFTQRRMRVIGNIADSPDLLKE